MTPEMQQEVALTKRLARIETILKRMCFELDLVINGLRHLLTIQGHRSMADQLGEQLETAHEERDQADTLPPDAQ